MLNTSADFLCFLNFLCWCLCLMWLISTQKRKLEGENLSRISLAHSPLSTAIAKHLSLGNLQRTEVLLAYNSRYPRPWCWLLFGPGKDFTATLQRGSLWEHVCGSVSHCHPSIQFFKGFFKAMHGDAHLSSSTGETEAEDCTFLFWFLRQGLSTKPWLS